MRRPLPCLASILFAGLGCFAFDAEAQFGGLLWKTTNTCAGICQVQGKLGTDGSASSGTTVAATFNSVVASGHAVAGCAVWNGAGIVISSISDDKGNTYNTGTAATVNNYHAGGFWLGNITNGPVTVTVTLSGSANFLRMVLDEYSGVAAVANPQEDRNRQGQAAVGNGTDAISSGSFTPVTNNSLIYGCTAEATGTTPSLVAGTGFTLRESGNFNGDNVPLASEDRILATAAATSSTFTGGNSTDWVTFGFNLHP